MTNINELRSEIVRNNENASILASALGITGATLSKKMNNLADFNQKEMSAIKKRYSLSDDVFCSIFFG